MRRFDIIILGLGPAGAVTAISLQKMGYNVALVGEVRRRSACEGLAQRTLEGLRRAGLERAQRIAGIEASRTASWNGATTAANSEFLVDRVAFDRALLEDSLTAGIPVIRGRIGVLHSSGDGWQAAIATSTGPETVSGGFLVEARGRRAPARGAIALRGPATLALAQKFKGMATALPQTYLASYSDGWCWLAQLGGGEAVLHLNISGRRADISGKASLTALMAAELAKLPDIRDQLASASPQGPVTTREATALLSNELATPNSLRVGDAAFAIDPLSGHGNFEAVGGAMAAAAVINSLLTKPENPSLALDYYAERATSSFLRHARVGRDFYRSEKRWPNAPFWQERLDWPDDFPAHEQITTPAIKTAAVIENGLIIEANVIVTAGQPRGIRMVDGVPVPELLSALQQAGDDAPPEAFARQFNAAPAQIKTAIQWLRHHGLLADQDSRRSAP